MTPIWPGIGLTDNPNPWRDFIVSGNLSTAARAAIERKRKEGPDPGTIKGMGRDRPQPAPKLKAVAPARGLSVAARMRIALANGPLLASELAQAVGIPSSHVRPCMLYDLEKGRVVRIGDRRPMRYALAGGAA